MCTLTFVALKNKFIITHNRDEQTFRPPAVAPRKYVVNNKNILFPKDSKAGGTWFTVSEKGTVLVLLNGAEEKHVQQANYRKSRGLIVLNLITATEVNKAWDSIDLENIEPFTTLLFEDTKLYQLQWNGTEKLKILLDSNSPYIWSSATLYSKQIRDQRRQWFVEFLEQTNNVDENTLLAFHQNTKKDDNTNGLIINRNNLLKTLSITQSVIENGTTVTRYVDLVANKKFECSQVNATL
jgi:uncharacterized protein with NRDE domain